MWELPSTGAAAGRTEDVMVTALGAGGRVTAAGTGVGRAGAGGVGAAGAAFGRGGGGAAAVDRTGGATVGGADLENIFLNNPSMCCLSLFSLA